MVHLDWLYPLLYRLEERGGIKGTWVESREGNMPDWKPQIRSRLASLRLSPSRENEIVEELSQHLEDRWRELVASGVSEDEATKLALAGFRDGDLLARHLAPLRQAHAPESITPGAPARRLLADLWQDLRYAARTLRKRPTFALAAILTLALGIGSNAAIFTIVNAILLRPLPLPHSEQLQAVYTRFLPSSGLDFPYFELSGPELADIRSRVNAYSGVAGYYIVDRTLSRDKGEAERVSTMQVTSGFFDVLGVGPVRGRTFTEEEARSGACLAVLSEDASGAAESIGSTIRLDDVPCEVIGVMPKALASVSAGLNPLGGVRADRITAWTPLSVAEDTLNNRGVHLMLGVARLRQGASAALADAQMQALREYWSATDPVHHAKGHFAVSRPLQEDIVGNHRDAWVLLGGAVIVRPADRLRQHRGAAGVEWGSPATGVRRETCARREPPAPDPAIGRRGDAPGGCRRSRRGRACEVAPRRSPVAVSAAAAGVAGDRDRRHGGAVHLCPRPPGGGGSRPRPCAAGDRNTAPGHAENGLPHRELVSPRGGGPFGAGGRPASRQRHAAGRRAAADSRL